MRFDVPQFIEVEDKIIGPFTLKQFLFLLAGGGILFLLWYSLPNLFLFILIGLPIFIIVLFLTFKKVNGRPFLTYLLSMLKHFGKPRLYLWRKEK